MTIPCLPAKELSSSGKAPSIPVGDSHAGVFFALKKPRLARSAFHVFLLNILKKISFSSQLIDGCF